VQACHTPHGFDRNETYARGMSRHSCKFCIMADLLDLITASNQPENAELYREVVAIEIESTFSFQSSRWLGDIAPHLPGSDLLVALAEARKRAAVRQAFEARAILVWGRCTEQGRVSVIDTYGVHDVLSLEDMITDLLTWQNEDFIKLLDTRAAWCAELFSGLRG
jgi:hypothetical protein